VRRERIDLRVLPAEKIRWAEAAEERGISLSDMIRRATEGFIADAAPLEVGTVTVAGGSWVMVDGKVVRSES
jgi:hypothetical protein